ncbi:MAG TPA: glycosyltransferase [Ktedonobacterales bacterium]|nr:glycosyltransferase [Ktedonobacterales bacterium]
MFLVDLLRPSVVVEVGTRGSVADSAISRAAQSSGSACQYVALNPWPQDADDADDVEGAQGGQGDAEASGAADEKVADLAAALAQFADGSIDLLCLAGSCPFRAVHDFERLEPKLSDQGVVVLPDLAERRNELVDIVDMVGAKRLWEALADQYPQHLLLPSGDGLEMGIVVVGSQGVPARAQPLFALTDADREAFARLAARLGAGIADHEEARRLRAEVADLTMARQEMERERVKLARDQAAALNMETARATALEVGLAGAQAYTAALESSRVVRLTKLARASGMVLRHKGPVALSRHVGQWLLGRRGYHLNDIASENKEEVIHPSAAVYQAWYETQRPLPGDLEAQPAASQQFAHRPLISFVTPVYNTDPQALEQTIQSVLAQTYDHWELCLVDGGSTKAGVRETLQRFAAEDPRIRVQLLDENRGIAGNSNAAVALARGEFVTLLDHDDLVEPDLLYCVVEAINQTPEADVVYYDENLLAADGSQVFPLHFRPAWSPELLLSSPYITHCTIRRQLLLDIGGFDPALDGAQDWDLFLRLSEQTDNVVRVPRVLYHWRMVEGSAAARLDAKPEVFERQLAAIRNHVRRVTGQEATAWWYAAGIPRVTWTPAPTHVSIIIPTKDKVEVLRRCLSSILKKTAYKDYDIVLVDTGSVEPATHRYYATLRREAERARTRVTIVPYEGAFNYSRACNEGARHAEGATLLFMNNDMEILDADWLDELVRFSNLPGVGVVGAKLLYPDRRIQHAGVVVGSAGLAGHIYYRAEEHVAGLFGSVNWYRDYLAVTGALHMMRREVYDAVGGYDETYDVSYSDVAFCYRATRLGLRILYDPFVRILHYESQTRDRMPSLHDMRVAGMELAQAIEEGDPFFSPHLSCRHAMPQLKRDDEPTPAQMLERSVGVSIETLKAQHSSRVELAAAAMSVGAKPQP